MVEAQGGDARMLERLLEIHRAPVLHEVPAPQSGKLARLDAGAIGRACIALGAGRAKATDAIDYAVGCDGFKKVGTTVERGEPLLRVHARSEGSLKAVLPMIEAGIAIE
jgi:thymidine phosphorylase